MQLGNYIFVISSTGDRVTIYDTRTEKARSIRLSASKEAPLEVVPVFGNSLMSLQLKGPKVSQVAVYDMTDGNWYPHDLKEPFHGTVSPILGSSVVACVAGRTIYGFQLRVKAMGCAGRPRGCRSHSDRVRQQHRSRR